MLMTVHVTSLCRLPIERASQDYKWSLRLRLEYGGL
jgi:hypothetical protein